MEDSLIPDRIWTKPESTVTVFPVCQADRRDSNPEVKMGT